MKSILKYSALLVFPTTYAYAVCVPWEPQNNPSNSKIIRIDLDAQNVFDPAIDAENHSFHQLTNKLRNHTDDEVVLRELLFKVGDQLDLRTLAETERILRSRAYIKDAQVFPATQCDDGVVVQVVTKDNWSLQPGLSFGTSGGKSKYSFELQEKNLLGWGKGLELKYKKGLLRDENSIEYFDPNLLGSTRQLRVEYQDNSDGSLKHINLKKPFFSLSTHSSWDIDYTDWTLVNPIYQAGEIVNELGQILTTTALQYGRLISHNDSQYHRILFGVNDEQSTFFNSEDFPNSELPFERDFQYPWVGYEFITEDFIEKTNFNSMGRTEDISLGHHLILKLGQDFNTSNTHFDFSYQKGFSFNPDNLAKLKVYATGIHQATGLLNSHFGIKAAWHHFQSPSKTLFVSTSLDVGENLFAERPQYLGAETGLRGYPFRYFTGNNTWLTTVEQRFFYDWYPLHSFQFASAVFVDAGSAWSNGQSKEVFSNVGIGFRLVPTRTSGGQVIHFDLAFPTESRPGLDSVQIQITAKKSF